METPPSSPPHASSSRNANDVASRKEDVLLQETEDATAVTPLTPDALEGLMMMSSSSSRGYHHHHHHGVPIISDLTPIISNSANYIDTDLNHLNNLNRLNSTPSSSHLPPPKLTPFRRDDDKVGGVTHDNNDDDNDDDYMVVSPTKSPYYGAARGLRQRRSSSGTSPGDIYSRRNSDESQEYENDAAAGGGGSTTLLLNDLLVGERLAIPNYDDDDDDDDEDNDHKIPSATIIASSASIFKEQVRQDTTIIGSRRHLSSPIELLGSPNRKFSSFQGVSQYKQRLDVDVDPREANRPSKMEKLLSSGLFPCDSTPTRLQQQQQQQRQYQPMSRSRHGVKEMAEAGDLDAIFKSPRRGKEEEGRQYHHVVSPHATAAAGMPMLGDGRVPPQQQQQQQQQNRQPMLSFRAEGPNQHHQQQQHHQHLLSRPYPVDERDWSIPSIRLANRVRGHPMDNSFASYADFSEYTAEDDLDNGSLHTYPEDDDNDDDHDHDDHDHDDDDSSMGDILREKNNRVSFISSGIFQRRASSSSEALGDRIPQTVYSQDVCDVLLLPTATTTTTTMTTTTTTGPSSTSRITTTTTGSDSFLEKMQGISIEVDDDDDDAGDSKMYPPVVDVDATASPADDDDDDDDANDAIQDSRPLRQHRNRGGRNRRRKEGAAVEWLQDLQDRSQNVSSSSQNRGEFLITEAASSKFLGDGIAIGGGGGVGGGTGQQNADPSVRATLEDDDVVTKALGLPHPLCRSSTIEAGPFVNRMGGGFGKGNDGDVGRGVQLHFHLHDFDMQQDQAIDTN